MNMIERLEATLASGLDNAQLRFGLASANFREARYDEAQKHAGVAVDLEPDYSAAWRILGRALIELGDAAAAQVAFEKGIAAAHQQGDMQLVKEMRVFHARLQRKDDSDTQ